MAATMEDLEKLQDVKAGTDTARPAQIKESAETGNKPQPPNKSSNKIVPKLLVGAVAVSALVGSYFWFQHAMSIEGTDDAYITGHVHQLSARVSGYVTQVAVDDNDHVKTGQTLVTIDPKDYQLAAESAKAAALKAQWQTVQAKSDILTNTKQADSQSLQAVSAIGSAQAQIHRAQESLNDTKLGVILCKTAITQRQSELTRAIADYERYKSLVDDRAVTTQAYDKAKQDKEVAQANLDGAQATYNQMLVKVKEAEQSLLDTKTNAVKARGMQASAAAAIAATTSSEKNVSVQQAAAEQAEVEYKNALTQLSYTKVLAPIEGTVGHKTVEVGQQIEKGQALMSIVSDEKWVVANFKETQLGRMHVGQEVEIKVDRIPNKVFIGHVQSLSPASGAQFSMLPPDNASGNFTKVVQRIPVKCVFDKESIKGFESMLAPGMSVVAEVHLKD
ncbi:MAG: HlyD family secretion protein [Candidatus Obscuribacterales bacterium]|nr:HlyD family secretion protein [Candidatus Obscuribacterales bacterium]